MPSGYKNAADGDWITPKRRGYRLMCCDCALVHTVNFRVVEGKVEVQFTRHARATAAARRVNRRSAGLPGKSRRKSASRR